jgi:hypothetical protein
MKRTMLALSAAFAIAAFAAADEGLPLESPAVLFPSSIGAFASTMIGGGLSYQRWNGPFGYAITLGGSIRPGSAVSGEMMSVSKPDYYAWGYNAELDLSYKLFSSTFANWLAGDLFVFALVAHRGGTESSYLPNVDVTKGGSYSAGDFRLVYSLGLGIGYEITLFKHFSLPLQFGYTAEWPLQLGFSFEGGLRYRY